MDAGPLSIVPRERGASEGRGGGAPFLDGKRGLLVAVVARVAREALAEAVVAVAEAAARALLDELVRRRAGRELDDGHRADGLVAGRRHAVELALADGAERPAGRAAADAEVLARVRRVDGVLAAWGGIYARRSLRENRSSVIYAVIYA